MFFNILKKDLKRKKSMNIILFIFIMLCTTFMASSANNLYTTLNALDYYAQVSSLSDYYFFTLKDDNVDSWIDSCDYVNDYEKSNYVNISSDNVLAGSEAYQTNGSIYFTKLPESYNLVLDENDQQITSIENGEIALSYDDSINNGLEIGDTITVNLGNTGKEFSVKYIIKDMALGTSYMSLARLMVSTDDYQTLLEADSSLVYSGYSVLTNDLGTFERNLNKQNFSVLFNFDSNSVSACYTMEMMTAGILMVVSIILIIIAVVILRFTIGFTIQEEYREIGIMKAIGLKNGGIKQLYIVKYTFLAVLGSVLGVILSIPLGNLLIDNIKKTMALESSSSTILLNLLCAVLVILLVIVFCYLSAGKINKFTAIQAIRSGSAGERFKAKSVYKIHRHTRAFLPLQMALNDILSSLKSYLVLIITFLMGTLLIILPLNMVNTLENDTVITLMGFASSDVFIDNNKFDSYIASGDIEYVQNDLQELEILYHESGVNIDLYLEYYLYPTVYTVDLNESLSIASNQALNFEATSYSYTDGTAPVLSNELAMTEICMEKLGVKIGDSINLIIGDTTKSYIITASYQSMNNLGEDLRFSASAETDFKYISNIVSIQGNFENKNDITGQIEKLKEITPGYSIQIASEFCQKYMGSIIETIDSLILMILLVVLFINCLITVLLMRMYLSKDSGEIALLKSIGFNSRSIQLWQALRILIILIVSILAAVLLSNLLNPIVVKSSFGIMGATNVNVIVEPWDVFFKYPLILFAVTGIAAMLSVISVKSISFKQLGNVE